MNILLKESNGGSMRDAVRIHNVEIVISLNLTFNTAE